MLLLLSPQLSLAQTSTQANVPANANASTTIVVPGLLPGDFFYFLDKLAESLETALTFNKEKKARIHLEYAKERVAEMKEILKDADTRIDDVVSIRADVEAEVSAAAKNFSEQKKSGSDVKDLAKELDDELDDIRDDLKDLFKEHRDEYSRAEISIRAKIALLATGDAQLKGLTQALASVTKEKEHADKEEEDVDEDLMDEQEIFEEAMDKEELSKEFVEEALELRNKINANASLKIPTGTQKLILDAEAAAKRGDYETAVRLLNQVENAMEQAEEREDEQKENNRERVETSKIDKEVSAELDAEISGIEETIESSLRLNY